MTPNVNAPFVDDVVASIDWALLPNDCAVSVTGSLDSITGSYAFQGKRFELYPSSSIDFRGGVDPELFISVSRLISGPCAAAPGERSGRRSSVGDLLAKPPSCHMGNASTVVPRDHELGRAPLTRRVGLVHSSRISV